MDALQERCTATVRYRPFSSFSPLHNACASSPSRSRKFHRHRDCLLFYHPLMLMIGRTCACTSTRSACNLMTSKMSYFPLSSTDYNTVVASLIIVVGHQGVEPRLGVYKTPVLTNTLVPVILSPPRQYRPLHDA